MLSFLRSPDVVGRLADALERAWSVLIAPDWPQLRAIIERDVVHRAGHLTRTGWAGPLDGMHPAVAWDTGGLRISNRPPLRTVLDGPGLLFVPSVFIYPGLSVCLDSPCVHHPAGHYDGAMRRRRRRTSPHPVRRRVAHPRTIGTHRPLSTDTRRRLACSGD